MKWLDLVKRFFGNAVPIAGLLMLTAALTEVAIWVTKGAQQLPPR